MRVRITLKDYKILTNKFNEFMLDFKHTIFTCLKSDSLHVQETSLSTKALAIYETIACFTKGFKYVNPV